MSAHPAARPAPGRWFRKRVLAHWQLLALLVIPVAWYIIFCYVPMFGVQLAFKNYKVRQGILGSPWADPLLRHFTRYFSSYYAWSTIWNTLAINLGCLLIGFPAPIILALVLNEINSLRFRKILQNITYIPYFLSIVVVVSMLKLFTDQRYGVINIFIQALGMKAIPLMESEYYFRPLYVLSNVWQNMGWNAIIYIAALAGVDTALYEAATVDGATRFQCTRYITLPSLVPTIVVMLILSVGSIMDAGFDQVFNLYNTAVYQTGDIIDTYVYRYGLGDMKYSLATAVGLFKNVIAFVLVAATNLIAKRISGSGIW